MTNKSKHTGVGLALGAALGAAFGVMAGHVGAWLAIGVAIGMLLGASFRRNATQCPECAQIHRAHEIKGLNSRATSSSSQEQIAQAHDSQLAARS